MSATNRKARGDSVLKTLPPARQEALSEYAATHTLAESVAWLKADGVRSNRNSVSEFLSWYSLQAQLAQNATTVETLLEQLKQSHPQLSPEALDQAGQMFFTALSIEQRDSLGWKRAQDIKVKNRNLDLIERRVKLLEQKVTSATEVLGNAEISEEEKALRMYELFGTTPPKK